jgi:hypothetical protein
MQSTSSSNTNIRKTNSFSFFFSHHSLYSKHSNVTIKKKRLYNFARKLKSFPAVWEISKSKKKKYKTLKLYKLNKRRCNFSLSIFIRHFFFRDRKTFRISIEQLRRWRRLYRHLFQKNSSIFFFLSLFTCTLTGNGRPISSVIYSRLTNRFGYTHHLSSR